MNKFKSLTQNAIFDKITQLNFHNIIVSKKRSDVLLKRAAIFLSVTFIYTCPLFAATDLPNSDINKAVNQQENFIIKEQNRLKLDQDKLREQEKLKEKPPIVYAVPTAPAKAAGVQPSFDIKIIRFEIKSQLSFNSFSLKSISTGNVHWQFIFN